MINTKEAIEEILTEYGVTFTDALAERLMKDITKALEQEPCENLTNEDLYQNYIHLMIENERLHDRIKALEQEPCREADDYENEIDGLQNRLDIAEYDKERLREEVTNLEAKIKALEQEPKWIPVSERLPEVGSEVLVCFDFKGKRSVYISHFYGDGEFHGLDDEYLTAEGRKYRKAVAWMPLPKPYEPQEREKWNGIHAQITAPKGTFERIVNDTDDDDDI